MDEEESPQEIVHGGLVLEGHAIEVVDNCVKNGQKVELETYMACSRNSEQIREYAWDLLPKVCGYLTEENLNDKPDVIEACELALKYLTDLSNPKELIIALLEQADTFKDNVKFKILLPPIQRCLLKLPSKRGHSVAIALETLMGHIESLPLPDDREFEGQEKMLLDGDERVVTINEAVLSMLDFLKPFVDEVSFRKLSDPAKDQRKERTELAKFLLRLLGKPLVFLDLSLTKKVVKKSDAKQSKEENGEVSENGMDTQEAETKRETKEIVIRSLSRTTAEKLMGMISQLYGDPISLMRSIMWDNMRIKRDRKKIKSKETQEGEGDADDGITLEEPISDESLGTYAYMVFSEKLGQDLLPSIYSHQFIFETCFPFSSKLLKRRYSLVAFKGVQLLLGIVTGLTPSSLSSNVLESDSTQDLLISLIAIMTRANMKELRQSAAQVVPHLLRGFDTRGRYLFLHFMLNKSVGNWGVRGLTASLLKNEIDANLKNATPSEYFCGTHLERLHDLVFILPKGAETDLLECSDLIMPALNLLRYLILRDCPADNVTGVWNYLPRIRANYIEVLRTGLNMSRAHYELELKHIKENKGVRSGEGVDANFHVAGQPIPQLSTGQQTQAMQMALWTFDMMESVVVRVSELLDQQKIVPATS